VIIDTGSSGSSTGVISKPEQEDSSNVVPKVNDKTQPRRVNLQIL
jgi:hypothetical protein